MRKISQVARRRILVLSLGVAGLAFALACVAYAMGLPL